MHKRTEIIITVVITLTVLSTLFVGSKADSQFCQQGAQKEKRYVLYDVNPGEGFNLRRDVYMRIAVFVKKLINEENVILVLPPWGPLYHWKSKILGPQDKLQWSLFFDVKSLSQYVPVIEFEQFLKESGSQIIDQVFYLQPYENAWSSAKWEEKLEIRQCSNEPRYKKGKDDLYRGWFWGYPNIRAANHACVSFQGHASLIKQLFKEQTTARSILIDRAENLLHDSYGDLEYWKVRRSMRFAKELVSLAAEFRQRFLNSSDETDFTQLPDDWRDEKQSEVTAIGGPFICGHLRRQDFLRGRPNDVPSLESAAKQLRKIAQVLKLRNIFIATDASSSETDELRTYLKPDLQLILYQPDLDTTRRIRDGGIAIVEQLICSRARYFIGTHESTFSFRIQEEREILNFALDTTFNRFCAQNDSKCEQPSRWQIVF